MSDARSVYLGSVPFLCYIFWAVVLRVRAALALRGAAVVFAAAVILRAVMVPHDPHLIPKRRQHSS